MKITSHLTSAKAFGVFTIIAVLGLLSRAEAATQYWDTNGATAGTGTGAQAGTWDAGTTSLWTSDPAGSIATGIWTNGNEASFSAGTNGTGLQTVTVSGSVSASGIVVKNGTLTLAGTSSPSLTIGSGGINVTSTNAGKTIFDGTLSRVNLSADQTWTAGGSSTGFTINSGITTNAASGTVTLTIAGGGTGTATSSNAGANLVDGTNAKLAFTYNNSGQLTMAGASTYSGGTSLSGTTVGGTSSAVIIVNSASVGTPGNPTSGVFGVGTITLNGGSVKLRANTTSNMTLYNNVTLAGNLQFVTASTNDKSLTLSGPLTISGSSRTINTDASQAIATPALGIISGNIGDGGNSLGLTKSGAGMLILTGSNTYTGDTRIGSGTLAIGAASGTGTLALQNTTVDLNAADSGSIQFGTSNATTTTSATFGGLKGSRNLALTNANTSPAAVALTVGGNGSSTNYSGNLSGTGGSLTKTGAGALTLSGNNDYSGATLLTTGTLIVSGALVNTSGITASGGTLQLGASNVINNTATLTLSGGTFAAQTFSDTLGALTLAGNSFITLGTGATIAFADSSAATWGDFTLNLTGFVSGSSLKFGSNAFGLDGTQLAKFTATGFSTFGLDSNGNLIATAVPEPATWILLFSGFAFVLVARRLRHRC